MKGKLTINLTHLLISDVSSLPQKNNQPMQVKSLFLATFRVLWPPEFLFLLTTLILRFKKKFFRPQNFYFKGHKFSSLTKTFFNRPCVAGAVLQTIRARELKFFENFHHPQHVMCHMLHVTCYMSHVMCRMSCVTCYIFFFYKVVGLTPELPFMRTKRRTKKNWKELKRTKAIKIVLFEMY